MSRSLPAPPTDPLSHFVRFHGDAPGAHANVAIAAPAPIRRVGCIPCVVSQQVWSASPMTRWSVRTASANHVDPRLRLDSREWDPLWDGNDRRLSANAIRRLEERVIDFDDVLR